MLDRLQVLEGVGRTEYRGKGGAQSRAQYKCSKRRRVVEVVDRLPIFRIARADVQPQLLGRVKRQVAEGRPGVRGLMRSEAHTSELQSLVRISYADVCLKQKQA